ncbi:hypothetical protein [Mesonia sp. K7]|uniref:hypothetical protein n=1 Tax=Mesonia sp. K7 TaxID=2218606 RepID=UPI0011B73651|nr:hypothetical protein [Mesonia sp. K7]
MINTIKFNRNQQRSNLKGYKDDYFFKSGELDENYINVFKEKVPGEKLDLIKKQIRKEAQKRNRKDTMLKMGIVIFCLSLLAIFLFWL